MSTKQKTTREFKIGDRVTWESQAQGSTTKKTGTVIEVVGWRRRPSTIRHDGTRDHESYVVEVQPPPTKRGRARKPVRYWPVVSKLRGAPGRKPAASARDTAQPTA